MDSQTSGIPSSVLEFRRSVNAGSGAGLHFRYDIGTPDDTDPEARARAAEELAHLRKEVKDLRRNLVGACGQGQRLQAELLRAQGVDQQLRTELAAVQGHAAHSARFAQESRRLVCDAREERARIERQYKTACSTNDSLKEELQISQGALEKERARTASLTSALAKERGAFEQLLRHQGADDKITFNQPSKVAETLELQTRRPSPSTASPSPSLGASSPIASGSPLPSTPRLTRPSLPPRPTLPITPCPSPLPPLTSLSAAHRPKASSTVPRPSLSKHIQSVTAGAGPVSARTPPSSSSADAGENARAASLSNRVLPAQRHADQKRKRVDDDDEMPRVKWKASPVPGLRTAPTQSDQRKSVVDWSDGVMPRAKRASPVPSTEPPEARLKPRQLREDSGPVVQKRKHKLGIGHLELLFETRGNTMHCRGCLRAFAATAAWADLVGHVQTAHGAACAELEMLSPAQVVERRQRLGKR
ncbi:hypothetical protein B0H10DRAFT_2040666 [Mycena sp. CBHHK59/15]|nr:hypothetical protein B0H10DRAFT_2040666 [Mycena sp. CBHHK59/15]